MVVGCVLFALPVGGGATTKVRWPPPPTSAMAAMADRVSSEGKCCELDCMLFGELCVIDWDTISYASRAHLYYASDLLVE